MREIDNYEKAGAEAYPILFKARREADFARQVLMECMERTFPVGTRVRVNHAGGSYTAIVRHNRDTSTLCVENEKTGKSANRYPLMSHSRHGGRPEVEIIE